MSTHALPTDQSAAILAATAWYHRRSGEPFKLFGAAGTGKTTIARRIADECAPDGTVFIAPTGKAASVLRGKGCEATTIHSAIYVPAAQRRAELSAALDELEALEADPNPDPQHVAALQQRIDQLNAPRWTLRDAAQAFGGKKPRLLVVDEASMVSAQIADDLASYGVPTIALGDPYQLPPVNGKAGYTSPADALLCTIHRYGESAPLMRLATAARTSEQLSQWNGTAGLFAGAYRIEHLARFDQIIVGRNATRWAIIDALRAAEGRTPGIPEPGDRVMVLRNDPTNDVVNGQQARITHVEPADRAWQIVTDGGDTWKVDRHGFLDHAGQQAAEGDRGSKLIAATFAQAITCHKSQGSQWETVAVIDESAMARAHARNWLYTAVTRASEQCIVLARPPAELTGPRMAAA